MATQSRTRTRKGQPAGPKRAAIYCRVSTPDQAEEDKVSLGEQLADCEAHCAERGYEVIARYRDVKTGTTSRRPDFQRMIAALVDGDKPAVPRPFDVIVCWKVDRLGRGMFPMARLLEVTDPAGIAIEAVKERVDQRYLGLFAIVGKIELDNTRERTTEMRRAYARRGKIMNAAVRYGYRIGADGRAEIDPAESAILLEVAGRYAGGEPLTAILDDLRARRVPTRSPKTIKHGLPWPEAYVSKLLADEAYHTGRRTFGGETVPYPPIFDAELWEAVKARRALNAYRAKRNTKVEYLLQHLMRCRCCGLGFTAQTKRYTYSRPTKEGRRIRYQKAPPTRVYGCGGIIEYPSVYACRKPGRLLADAVEAAVWQRLVGALRDPDTLLQGVRARLAALEAAAAEEPYGPDADRQLAQMKLERLEIVRQRARGAIDDATMDLLTGEVDARAASLQERAEAERRLRADAEAQRRVYQNASAYLDGLRRRVGNRIDALTFAERRELLLALVDQIWVDGDNNLTIEGALGDAPADQDGEDSSYLVNCSIALSKPSM
jgi:DNA invertase Pin-like site-specific DNA recombinase